MWGIPGSEIHSEWAAQRIKDFSFWKALLAILQPRAGDVDDADRGVPLPAARARADVGGVRGKSRGAGIPVHRHHRALTIHHDGKVVESVDVQHDGRTIDVPVDAVLSSIPLSELVLSLDPPPARRRSSRRPSGCATALCLVALVIDEDEPFPDNWIYLHDPGTRAGRVQNFGAWSPDMVGPGTTCLGVEYFCFEGDDIWEMPDEEAVAWPRTSWPGSA